MDFLKYYLLHYIYAIIYTLGGMLSGEDQRTIGLMFGLSIFLSTLIYLYNSLLTLLGFLIFRPFNFTIGPFVFPIIIGVISHKYLMKLMSGLDIGAHQYYWLILIIASLINLSAYYFTIKKTKVLS